MDIHEDTRLRRIALEALDAVLDVRGRSVKRSEVWNLEIPASTPHLMDLRKGIWNPKWLMATLSLATTQDGDYHDIELDYGLWEYSYRAGTTAGDNLKLQRAAELGVDVIYFREEQPRFYTAYYPVKVLQCDPDGRKALLSLPQVEHSAQRAMSPLATEVLRSWTPREVRVRDHQKRFRELVLDAYGYRCAVCELPFEELLDAAHIDADSTDRGDAAVGNGISLCKLHHRAFDVNFIGISPGRIVHVSPTLKALTEPPMIVGALNDFQGRELRLPRAPELWPEKHRLSRRWKLYRARPTFASLPSIGRRQGHVAD